MSASPLPIAERYRRASEVTAPKIASTTVGQYVEGYWLDRNRFYFLQEAFDSAIGRIVATPSIIDAESGNVTAVMPLGDLAALLSRHSDTTIDRTILSAAQFDMPGDSTLAVMLEDRDFIVSLRSRTVLQCKRGNRHELYSPDGRYAVFVKGHDLWIRERAGDIERPLTAGGQAHNAYGQQTECARAAISERKHPKPLGMWSPDSQWFS